MRSKEETLLNYRELETSIDHRLLNRIVDFLTVDELDSINVKVKDEYKDEWIVKKEWNEENIIIKLIDDAKFGRDKAKNERGISSALMYKVCTSWLWILEDDSFKSLTDECDYGLNFFSEVIEKYSDYLFENYVLKG